MPTITLSEQLKYTLLNDLKDQPDSQKQGSSATRTSTHRLMPSSVYNQTIGPDAPARRQRLQTLSSPFSRSDAGMLEPTGSSPLTGTDSPGIIAPGNSGGNTQSMQALPGNPPPQTFRASYTKQPLTQRASQLSTEQSFTVQRLAGFYTKDKDLIRANLRHYKDLSTPRKNNQRHF